MRKKFVLAIFVAVVGALFFHGISVAGICPSPGCVVTSDIKDKAVTAKKIRVGAVNTWKILDGTIQNVDIKDKTITGTKVASGSLTGTHIASYSITGADLEADIILGHSTDDGSLRIEYRDATDILNVGSNSVTLGQSGSPNRDVDLFIRDPGYSTTANALYFNASTSDLFLGSGTSDTPGDDGDIYLYSGTGSYGMRLYGSVSDAHLGYGTTTTTGNDGDIYLYDNTGSNTISLDGQSGNVTNPLSGNGLVKAWAMILADGTVKASWRCNTSTSETRRITTGVYEVDFTPLSTDITGRPRMLSIDGHSTVTYLGFISVADRGGDPSSLYVTTRDTTGTHADRPFLVMIF